ncbi:hypothetical protein SteCoe_23044 [Stentor coeruleus]|uniref:Uncharacterized protein n=1 Tax=Stentor coeruleus TaxID=5963 RepID=A0A1R2BLH8_9CILI|nr:hypothetical protein SteCoe_23044 [Stentor coeruleus]
MKARFILLMSTVFIAMSSIVTLESQCGNFVDTCEECQFLFKNKPQCLNYCINYNNCCSEAIVMSELSSLCSKCLDVDSFDYPDCVYKNCPKSLSQKVEQLAINSLHSFGKQALPSKSFCSSSSSSFCIYYSSPTSLSSISFSSESNCETCKNYKGSFYSNCVYFYCRNEISSQYLSSSNLIQETSLSECTDACYYDWYYFQHDYSTCVKYNCKKSSSKAYTSIYLLAETSTKISQCEACYYYYKNNDLTSCSMSFCHEEIINGNKLFSQNDIKTSYCTDCNQFWQQGYYDDYYECVNWYCKDLINEKTLEFFKGQRTFTSARGGQYNDCIKCEKDYQGQAKEECIYYFCAEKILGSSMIQEIKENLCIDNCYQSYVENYYSYEEYYSCAYDYCKEGLFEMYKVYLDKIEKITNVVCEECDMIESGYLCEKCLWYDPMDEKFRYAVIPDSTLAQLGEGENMEGLIGFAIEYNGELENFACKKCESTGKEVFACEFCACEEGGVEGLWDEKKQVFTYFIKSEEESQETEFLNMSGMQIGVGIFMVGTVGVFKYWRKRKGLEGCQNEKEVEYRILS